MFLNKNYALFIASAALSSTFVSAGTVRRVTEQVSNENEINVPKPERSLPIIMGDLLVAIGDLEALYKKGSTPDAHTTQMMAEMDKQLEELKMTFPKAG